nr:S8 family serine peptidase [Candidatus Korarchaeota archaeon]NIU85602.1 S8 family serine peptidase [Candidatus Thorarchaeota archaeon]NIW15707.1 S8 family serine peptidase [Candidatus Thorarchaeota archaeon]NIW53632.1 S8 family serine peptidase [Candidatus Korarchaeota archaeon]
DLVAPGTYITSANAGYAQGSDWAIRSGTSMATPMVAGAAALIIPFLTSQYDFTSPNLPLKALLINTAQDMGGSSSTQGFGYMALTPAWDTKTQLYQTNLGDGDRKSYWARLTKDQEFTATIVWNKHVSSYSGWSSDFHDVSNLDLELLHPNGSLLAASNDSRGTVEKIHLNNAPAAGLYRLVIHGKSVSSPIGNETIALTSTHTLFSAPLSFKIDPPTLEGTLGTNLLIHANVTNHASENISNLEASLSLPNKLGLYSNQNESNALLEPNASWLPSWNISLTGLGEFQFSITLTAATLNESFRQSGIIIIRTETNALTVESKNKEGTIDDTLQLNITVTNLASATVHNLTLTLSLPTQITTVNDVQRSKDALKPGASWRPTWELTLEQAGNFTYHVTLSSPDLLGQIETSGEIAVHEKADEVPTRWILIGLGIVGIVVLLLLIRKGTKKGNKSSRLRFSSLTLKFDVT